MKDQFKLEWRTRNPALVLYMTQPDPIGLLRVHRTERRRAAMHRKAAAAIIKK